MVVNTVGDGAAQLTTIQQYFDKTLQYAAVFSRSTKKYAAVLGQIIVRLCNI